MYCPSLSSDVVAQRVNRLPLPFRKAYQRLGRFSFALVFRDGHTSDPGRYFLQSHPALLGEELRVQMASFRALCNVVDFDTSRGSILSKVHEP